MNMGYICAHNYNLTTGKSKIYIKIYLILHMINEYLPRLMNRTVSWHFNVYSVLFPIKIDLEFIKLC